MIQPFHPQTALRAVAPLLTFHVDFEHPDCAVVHLTGEVDHFNSWVISSLIEGTVLAGCHKVELDAHEVAFTDSSILSAIERCSSALTLAECRVSIRRPSRSVLRVLDLLDALWLLDDRDLGDVWWLQELG